MLANSNLQNSAVTLVCYNRKTKLKIYLTAGKEIRHGCILCQHINMDRKYDAPF